MSAGAKHKYEKVDEERADPKAEAAEDEDPGGVEAERFGEFTQKLCIGQVTVRLPLNWRNPLSIIGLMYGFLPWIIPAAFLISFLVEAVPEFAKGWRDGTVWLQRTRIISLYGILISVVLAIINEGILKPILKQPRPVQTANRYPPKDGQEKGEIKHGMPSGHVMNATTVMWWSLLEVAVAGPHHDPALKAQWCLVIWVLMGPVFWARWYNLDHTFNQCLVSSILGTLFGCIAFYIRVKYYGRYEATPWVEQDPQLTF
mmetsp:Transcript_7857/g.17266  ORF Transcript_7857/g.17266 Transcript_7857/m.17266 type:complete len:258 (+) Transcript_7857:84-857(+)|eukprot:CAMPEP_0178400376 /NCGR_PEP_ID=MMETSP0689_2-20121128/15758_1 /TAXON_ID=160604 /ORGANISM="Amphidinium massartii, Strain CS-259" /LENGTH=257 /DNA_ID=CAMNT_0020021171 /DNA_START=84 /DNA_END=857 /DNA_ORIENTATION=+